MKLKKFSQLNEADIKDTLPEDYLKGVKDRAKPYLGGPTSDDIKLYMETMRQIISIQKGNEDKLTEIGIEIIMEHYSRMLEDVELDIKIVSPDDKEKSEMVEKMIDDDDDDDDDDEEKEEEKDTDDDFQLPGNLDKDEVDRRKLINNIMQGESQNVHSMIYTSKEKIDEISPKLADLYIKFLEINRKFDWDDKISLEKMMKSQPKMTNAMETEYPEDGDEDDGKVRIKARVLDLPMLIHETIKGIYELMSAKAIPEDPVMAQKILGETDSLTDEEQDIMYGPFIASDIRDYLNDLLERTTDQGTIEIPNIREFIFSQMMELPANIFVQLIKDILTGNHEDADKFLRGGNDLVKQSILNALGEVDDQEKVSKYDDEDEDTITTGENEEEDEMLKPRERSYADMSKTELNDLINKAIDEDDFELMKKITPFL